MGGRRSFVAGLARMAAGKRLRGRGDVTAGRPVRLATATTERYVPGTLVLVDSFLRRHPGFDGEIVVIHDGLPGRARAVLAATSDAVRFVPVPPALRERAERLCAALAPLPMHPAQFWILEAFRLTGAARLLLCDGDLLFRAPVDELFDSTEELLCCGDLAFLHGRRVDADTFLPVDSTAVPAPGRSLLRDTFNSGFLCIDGRLAGERVYADLLAAMSPAHWRGLRAPLGEQPLLNRYFAGRQTLVSSTYNFLLPGAAAIRAREGVELRSAKVLHFNVPAKPWRPDAMLRRIRDRGSRPAATAFRLWHDAFVEALVNARVRTAARGWAGWAVG